MNYLCETVCIGYREAVGGRGGPGRRSYLSKLPTGYKISNIKHKISQLAIAKRITIVNSQSIVISFYLVTTKRFLSNTVRNEELQNL